MRKTVSVALVGIGGYGGHYLGLVLDHGGTHGVKLVGVVDPWADRSPRLDDVRKRGAIICPDLDTFYRQASADLVVIASPIHLHCPQSLQALPHGACVLCEKPLAGSFDDGKRMAEAAAASKGFLAVGYQWSFSATIQQLKRDIMAGDFGCPVRLKTIGLWPRPHSYFTRNDWAGRQRSADGRDVFDSPINNATAHYLHNIFYVLGATREQSAWPCAVEAELYRANNIENFDTAVLRARTEQGAEVLYYATHAVAWPLGPIIAYEFERAMVSYEHGIAPRFVARFKNGATRNYGDPNDQTSKLWECVEAVRTGAALACGAAAALPHALCVQGAQTSMPEIADFPPNMVGPHGDPDPVTCVGGLEAAIVQCYDQGILLSEHGGLDWSRKGQKVQLSRDGVGG